jgi:hypothetical protein
VGTLWSTHFYYNCFGWHDKVIADLAAVIHFYSKMTPRIFNFSRLEFHISIDPAFYFQSYSPCISSGSGLFIWAGNYYAQLS